MDWIGLGPNPIDIVMNQVREKMDAFTNLWTPLSGSNRSAV